MIQTPFEDALENYEIIRLIAGGTYADVFEARNKVTDLRVALKKMKNFEAQGPGISPTSIREISILKSITHQNIVEYKGVIMDQPHLYVVLQLLESDLKTYLVSYGNEQLPFFEVKKFLHQIVKAISYCHSRKIIHRDLKLQNILIDQNRNLKITDFGLARKIFNPPRPYTTKVVTLPYRAPELLLGQAEYDDRVDIWSIGCIFAELLTKKVFFPSDGQLNQLDCIFRKLGTPTEESWSGWKNLLNNFQKRQGIKFQLGMYQSTHFVQHIGKDQLSSAGFDLLKQMLTCDPQKRISAQEALSHPYFNDLQQ